jgi:hypothetical protein
MVEVNGMLVSAAAAERRRFLSALVQRAAKRLSGGTLTVLLALRGTPASGDRTAATAGRAPPSLDQYKHLSEELKVKMAKALAAKAAAEEASVPLIGTVLCALRSLCSSAAIGPFTSEPAAAVRLLANKSHS